MKRKLNFVDYIIIAIVVVVVGAGAFYFIKRGSSGDEGAKIITGKQTVEIVAEAHAVLPEVANRLKVGDKVVAQKRFQDGELIEFEVEEDFKVGAKGNEIVKVAIPETRYVRAVIRGKANRYGPYLDMGNQMLKVGETYWIKTDNTSMFGAIIGLKVIDDSEEK